jgi:hypothetical protein
MKSFLKALALVALTTGSLIQGYAIVFDKNSPVPYVDVYTYKVNSVADATKKHGNYARLQGLPTKVVEILEKGKGPSEAIALALAAPTEGASVAVQKGVYTVVGAGKAGIKLFDRQIAEGLGRAFRGKDDAFHEDVWRGNRGRDAEWKTDSTMYAIVTLPNNLLPLGEPIQLPTRGVTGFTLVPTGDANVPYKVQWTGSMGQYISAETDTFKSQDKGAIRRTAATSGEAAYNRVETKK